MKKTQAIDTRTKYQGCFKKIGKSVENIKMKMQASVEKGGYPRWKPSSSIV
jgi:hypothetical protein